MQMKFFPEIKRLNALKGNMLDNAKIMKELSEGFGGGLGKMTHMRGKSALKTLADGKVDEGNSDDDSDDKPSRKKSKTYEAPKKKARRDKKRDASGDSHDIGLPRGRSVRSRAAPKRLAAGHLQLRVWLHLL